MTAVDGEGCVPRCRRRESDVNLTKLTIRRLSDRSTLFIGLFFYSQGKENDSRRWIETALN